MHRIFLFGERLSLAMIAACVWILMSPKAIAEAIDYLVTHPEEVKRMGDNGKVAVQERYNWRNEETKLLNCMAN